MTAEIAVMNKVAVAMAADSAATSQHGANTKIYNTADKLFQLDGKSPVGIMTYGAAEFMGIPWETVIKLYRKYHLGPHPHLQSYGSDFLRFLASPDLLSDSYIDDRFVDSAASLFEMLRKQIVMAAKGTPGDFNTAAENLTNEILGQIASGTRLQWATEQIERELLSAFDSKFEKQISEVFKGENLGITTRQNLKRIFVMISQFIPQAGEHDVAGLAIAGFGEAEFFPDAWNCVLRGAVPGRHLQVHQAPIGSVGPHCSARIIPFAQAEMVHSFMRGIDPRVQEMVFGSFHSLLQKLVAHLSGQINGLPPDQAVLFKKEAEEMVKKLMSAFQVEFEAHSENNYVSPVIGAVGVLPKDELAVMAETLVALTSFKRRMSRDAETVGGAIDVAVISKGDGFVWIKRKHYFDPHLNVRYMKRLNHGETGE